MITIEDKKNILGSIIEKLNNKTLSIILKYFLNNNIYITQTKKYYMFDISTLTHKDINCLWDIIFITR